MSSHSVRLITRLLRLRRTAVAAMLVLGASMGTSQAGSIDVPNYSFESPSTDFVSIPITSWQKTAQPFWYPNDGDYSWAQTMGIFANLPGEGYITNTDSQVGYIFGIPEAGLYQDLSATFTSGQDYKLTLAVVGQGGGMLEGVTLDLMLYYRDVSNVIVPLGITTIVHNGTNFPNHVTAYDFSLDVSASTILAQNAVGKNIGIQILSTANFVNQSGYWDIDNVRLTETPEPGSAGLLLLGGLALLQRRARVRRV